MSTTTLNSIILRIMRKRQVKGLTVGEIFDRVCTQARELARYPVYSSIRARVYELVSDGKLYSDGVRKDTETGRKAATFLRCS